MKNDLSLVIQAGTFLASLLFAGTALAAAMQSHAVIRDTVNAYVQTQTQAIPGKVSVQVGTLDPRINLPACPALEAFLPAGMQLNGNASVGVRCNGKVAWSLFVPVSVKISSSMLTLNRTVLQGQTLQAEDLNRISSETVQPGTFTDPAQAIGKVMKYGVAAGQILRQDMVRAPYSIRQGQPVKLQVVSGGFRVSSEGTALANAADGDTTTARTPSGNVVSGRVNRGIIEIPL